MKLKTSDRPRRALLIATSPEPVLSSRPSINNNRESSRLADVTSIDEELVIKSHKNHKHYEKLKYRKTKKDKRDAEADQASSTLSSDDGTREFTKLELKRRRRKLNKLKALRILELEELRQESITAEINSDSSATGVPSYPFSRSDTPTSVERRETLRDNSGDDIGSVDSTPFIEKPQYQKMKQTVATRRKIRDLQERSQVVQVKLPSRYLYLLEEAILNDSEVQVID